MDDEKILTVQIFLPTIILNVGYSHHEIKELLICENALTVQSCMFYNYKMSFVSKSLLTTNLHVNTFGVF